MKTLCWLAVLSVVLFSGCQQKAGGGNVFFHGEATAPAGISEPSLDTPPIAGPSEENHTKPETPISECDEELYGVNCPEVLAVSKQTLCTRENTTFNPLITGSQATLNTPKPMASNGVVDHKIWRYSGEDAPNGSKDFVLAPIPDLKPRDPDADPVRPGTQLAVNPDGSFTTRLVAGEKTGYYEIWIEGDLDTAFGSLTIQDCGGPSEEVSNPVDSSTKTFLAP